jgi:hypothetical protein
VVVVMLQRKPKESGFTRGVFRRCAVGVRYVRFALIHRVRTCRHKPFGIWWY